MGVKQKGTKRPAEKKVEKFSKKSKLSKKVEQPEPEPEPESESESESESEASEASEASEESDVEPKLALASDDEPESEDEDDLDSIDEDKLDNEQEPEEKDEKYEKMSEEFYKKYENPSEATSQPAKQTSKEQHEGQKKLLKERKTKRKSGIEVERIKKLWEKLRVKNPPLPKEVRDKLSNEIWGLCEGVLGDLVLKHDASRAVQTLVKYSTKERRDDICKELRPYYYKLATSAYGKYLLIKLLHYGSKESRAIIIKELHGKLRKLMRHREGAYVVEDMFVLYSTSKQRHQMIREFWGSQYAYFIDENDEKSVVEVCNESAEKRRLIASNLFGTIKASVEKGSTGFQILHAAMKEYIQIFEGKEVRDFIELLQDQVAELVHTPEGCEVACTLLAKASAKERKSLLKSLKTHAEALATNEHGQTVLQVVFMTVDDTNLVQKTFLPEYTDKMVDLLTNKFSRRPFIYLLNGLDKSYFSPILLKELEKFKELSKETSKKPEEERRKQILKYFLPVFYETFLKNSYEILNESMGAQFIQELIYNNELPEESTELRGKAVNKIIDCVRGNLENEDHIIHKPFTPRLLKSLIQGGKWNKELKKIDEVDDIELGFDFAIKFIEEIFDNGADEDTLVAWISNKESSFVLVGLVDCFKLHSKEEISKDFLKTMKKYNKTIKKQEESNKGAHLLLKVLN